MCDKENNCVSWKAFWCSVIILAAVWEVYDYIDSNYCDGIAIPVRCSK